MLILSRGASVSPPCAGTCASCAPGTAEINANTQKALGALWKPESTRMTMSSHATACQLSLRVPLHGQSWGRKGVVEIRQSVMAGAVRRGRGTVLLPGGWHLEDFQIETGQNAEKPGGMLPSSKPLLSGNWLRDGVESGPHYQLVYCRNTQAHRQASRVQGFP